MIIYDPETGRFISADAYLVAGDHINSTNMFAYCLNNPVMFVDPRGTNPGEMALDPSAQISMGAVESLGIKEWGFYADSQAAAKALAVVLGNNEKPEVHGSGYYAHYHDGTHKIHKWYGGKIRY